MNSNVLVGCAQTTKAEEPLQGYQVDFTNHKAEALEAIQLAKAGVDVPEESIYYDDDAIVEDEAFEGEWTPVATDGLAEVEAEATLNVRLQLDPEVKAWLDQQSICPARLLEQLLVNFYRAQQRL